MDNILAYKNRMEGPLKNLQKLSLSWWDRKAVIKMTLFHNWIISNPIKCIEEIQSLLNNFLWQGGKPRIQMSLLQQGLSDGGIAFPFIRRYLFGIQTDGHENMVEAERSICKGYRTIRDTSTLEKIGIDRSSIVIIRST